MTKLPAKKPTRKEARSAASDRLQSRFVAALACDWPEAQIAAALAQLEGGSGRFPPGRRGLPEELVIAVQRERTFAAALAVVAARGYRRGTVREISAQAGISKTTFYALFADKEDCFIAACEGAIARFSATLAGAARPCRSWNELVHTALRELLAFLDREPETARAVLVELRSGTRRGRALRDAMLERAAASLESGRRRLGSAPVPAPIVAAGVAGGIESVLRDRLRRGELPLLPLLGELERFCLLQSPGEVAAPASEAGDEARSSRRPAPVPQPSPA